MSIIQDFIPTGRDNRPGIPIIGPKFITIHDTANPAAGADALMHEKYLRTDECAERPASWHFTVDSIRIVQNLPLNEIAWHAGDGHGPGNMSSLAIEICENADGNREKAEENATGLVADLLKQFKLPIESVVQHNRWSGKNCPHVIRSRPGGWDGFIEKVRANMEPKPEDWKQKIMDAAVRHGLIEEGKHQPDEQAPKWFILATVLNAIRDVTGKDPYK